MVTQHPLVHMGAELCELNRIQSLFLSPADSTHVSWTCCSHYRLEFLAPFLNSTSWILMLNKRSIGSAFVKHNNTTIKPKSSVASLQWDIGSVILNLFTSELQRRWRRRKMLQGWVALRGGSLHRNVWQRLSIETCHSLHRLSCFHMSWEEDGEWGPVIHLVIFHSNFPLHYFCHYTPVSWSQRWNLYFGWQVSARLHLMSNK